MKIICLSVLLFCCTLIASAQLRWGFRLADGFSYLSKPSVSKGTINSSNQLFYTLQAGLTADWQLSKHLHLQPSLVFSSKGGKNSTHYNVTNNGTFYVIETKGSIRHNYIELPLNLLYKFHAGSGKLFAGIGGYAAEYLGGKMDGAVFPQAEDGGITITPIEVIPGGVPPPTDPADRKLKVEQLDAGANITAGYEFRFGLQLGLNYSYGLTQTNYGKNRVATISVAYLFK
ncbi:Outer membrane protein beta-barrel domain-containing protein [Chitinophaga jiangningensis]|uniref:Outer membrane protein beta-barrel domain-containing protein n=1 Tax=Chitinophaga jiangningensis TaxID=1419482 RepID=A0A1M7JXH1_9BACT|nr:outer membrane beta-barrel protein [Chitinophaga jiangningensis]SHM57772.1 Outer membrane protein beta-barrel domain-containing protein [Chitinophaga jiangningensis]